MTGVSPVHGSIVPPALRDPYLEGKIAHPPSYTARRFLNWFPLGLSYGLLYMGRYNLTVAQGALGPLMSKEAFGDIFAIGTAVYGVAFVLNGPLTDRWGGRRAMMIALAGAFLANVGMGLYLDSVLKAGGGGPTAGIKTVMSVLYGANMYFQSFGAIAIVKVNSAWFHVRERGSFSGIFGIMNSSGLYLAYDVNERALRYIGGERPGAHDAYIVFALPAALLALFFLIEVFLLRDLPSEAGHEDIETGAADDHAGDISAWRLFVRILSNPIILTVALIEFCTGVIRQGIMQWFRIYAKEQTNWFGVDEQIGATGLEGFKFALDHWGAILAVAGIIGGTVAGLVSDKVFQSRRAPAAALLYGLTTACTVAMYFTLRDPWILVVLVFLISLGVIGTHGLLSGTATMDFGGKKGTATAVGLIDGFVYLGSAVQGVALGRITERAGWAWWPVFLVPFGVIGLVLLARIWHAIPKGKKAGGH